jgi:gentisate 1,2-dioxygenase
VSMIANDTLEELFQNAAERAANPLWVVMEAVNPPEPSPKAIPHVWRYREMRPLLERAGRLVDTERAERRVFMLINPGIAKLPYTTDTLYAGLQLILPGEVARAHRHVAFALRFIIEGGNAYTAVGGEKVLMNPGDLVLTPSFEYHDHGNETQTPMIWLDGLDVPLYQWLPVHFTNPYNDKQYPSEPAPRDSRLLYPWAEMQRALDAQSGSFAAQRYVHRTTGGEISATIGAAAERVDRGTSAPRRRETASSIYHVYAGRGKTRIGNESIAWERNDTFAIPAWFPFEHVNTGDETAYLFRYDDRPLLESMAVYRTETA